jgi:signal transduction histidine kinase
MLVATTSRPVIHNHLLAALPLEEYESLLPYMEYVELPFGEILYAPDERIRYVYFPNDAIISLVSEMRSGASAEVGLVSREGMVGLPVFLNSERASYFNIVLVTGSAIRVKEKVFRDEFMVSRSLRDALRCYTQALLTQTAQTTACNRLHHVEERFARWLLSLHDRVEGDEFKLTHEIIAQMLGVRRAGVSTAATKFRRAGLIQYNRGHIHVIDRIGLEAAACECYAIIKAEFDRLHVVNLANKLISAKSGTPATPQQQRLGEEGEKALESLREINSRLIIAGIREQEAREEAEEANRAKDEFLATVSHELRTPLNAMLGWSRMLRAKQLDQNTSRRALEIIERNAEIQAQLIEDLLDVSRIIAGKLKLDVRPVNLSAIIAAAVEDVRPTAEAKHIRLESALGAKADSISGDAKRLQQIVSNLLSNAIKFTPAGGSVNIRLEDARAHARITVSDTGVGISAEFLPHVFDRFRQADGMMRDHTGLGLGLAIVHHLVELHGGKIHAESPGEGMGATFTVNLPLSVNGMKRSENTGGKGCTIKS